MHGDQINETISSLIKNYNQYIDNFNTRLQINSIFNEFEDKAHRDLMSLIKLSNNRYKGVKSGNSINSVLSKQKPIYNRIINKVLNDEFYNNSEIETEKRKFTKMNNVNKNAEILNLRQKIKENAKILDEKNNQDNLYEAEGENKIANVNFLHKLQLVKSPIGKMINGEENDGNVNSETSRRERNSNKRRSYSNVASLNESIISNPHQQDIREISVEVGKIFPDIVLEDKEKFEKLMESYRNHLDNLKLQQEFNNTAKSSHKFTFLTDDLKLLSYKQSSNQNIIEKKNDNTSVEVKKLIKYTKSSQRGNNNSTRTVTNAKTLINDYEDDKLELDNKKLILNLQNVGEDSKSHDTLKLVKSEVVNSINLENIIQKKQNNLDQYLKDHELPNIDDYEKIINRNITTKKISKQTSTALKDIVNNSVKPEAYNAFKILYEEKKLKFDALQNNEFENHEKLEKLRKKENKIFFDKIKNRSRFPQQYMDQYSIREQTTNKNIVELNKYLGKHMYDKRKLNKKIDEFIIEPENKNREKLLDSMNQNINDS